LNSETVLLHSGIDRVIEPLALTASQKGVELRNNIEDDLTVFADLNMLKLVLRNLISNGIKFTNKSGFVAVSAVKKDMIVEVTVSDNGVGIAEGNLEKLFRDDVRYSTDGTSKEQGTGLGLLLCKEIVEKHGGKIWVESDPDSHREDKGSKFCFTIPTS
jgi:two-component system sensor histidine kinase/response regulator